jgi:hypothetical protein
MLCTTPLWRDNDGVEPAGSIQESAALNGQMQPLLGVSPACLWTPSPSEDEPGLCLPSRFNWLLLPVVPSSPMRRCVMHLMQHTCSVCGSH